jgi:hypothetical protein
MQSSFNLQRSVTIETGRAIAQTSCGRLLTAAERDLSKVKSCWFCGGVGRVFSTNLDFPCQFSFHQPLHIHW